LISLIAGIEWRFVAEDASNHTPTPLPTNHRLREH
jgi:hypothetical protein